MASIVTRADLRKPPAAARVAGRAAARGVLLVVVLAASVASSPRADVSRLAGQEPIAALPAAAAVHREKAALGEKLFHDRRLSGGGQVACASCHRLDRAGDDGRALSTGADGQPLDFNSPTVFNAAFNFRLNWRGNFRSFEEQAEAVLLDRRLMNASWEALLAMLRADPLYSDAFAEVYQGPPERTHVLDALAEFQRSLLASDAPFDQYLRGKRDAISAEQERGYQLFKAYGCAACHQGVNVGGNLFQKFGIFHDPFARRPAVTQADLGRFAVTGQDSDRHVFRVPSLRNVAVTSPYFHDGSTPSLPEAVEIMARSQLGRDIPAPDVEAITSFLATLTGTWRGRSLTGAGPP